VSEFVDAEFFDAKLDGGRGKTQFQGRRNSRTLPVADGYLTDKKNSKTRMHG
jgi:hypothetical protein